MTLPYQPMLDALKWLKASNMRGLYYITQNLTIPFDLQRENLDSLEFVYSLIRHGAKDVQVQSFDNDDRTSEDTLFITIPDPLPKLLLIDIVESRPDEFDEIEPNVFRLWWD